MGLTRGADAALIAALAGPFHPVVLVRVDWPGAPVRVHSGIGALSWDGFVWTGVGRHGEIRLPEEGFGLAQSAGSLRIGGLPAEIDAHLGSDVRGREVDVWFGVVTARAGTVLVGTPVSAFAGYVDGMADEEVATEGGLMRVIDLAFASGPSQRSRTSAHHSYEDQITTYPGDTAGRWVKAAVANAGAVLPKW